ncbi:Indole-3-acetate O-methyltransferase 1 [Asimina triloba]
MASSSVDDQVQGDNLLVVVPQMKLERLLSMKGGKGEASYANNSQAQARHARSMLHLLEATLDAMPLPVPAALMSVADLGCSSGTNTLFIVDVIIKHLMKRYEASGIPAPEFQAFFGDLPSNDFNTLFQLLPPMFKIAGTGVKGLGQLEWAAEVEGPAPKPKPASAPSSRSYYAAGVAGSFYRRLFPARSIHVFHSAFSLHWLSQCEPRVGATRHKLRSKDVCVFRVYVPESVMDQKSVAYNKGRVFIHGASRWTGAAYREQYQKDLAAFLRARSQELVGSGGAMFLVCLGRTSADPTDQGGAGLLFGAHFQDAWNELVEEGLVKAQQRDQFNIPVYAASLKDFKEVVESEGSFCIDKLDMFLGGSPLVVDCPDDAAEVGRALANSCRAVCGVLVDAHLGHHLSDELFHRLERRAAIHANQLLHYLQFFHIVASLSLR